MIDINWLVGVEIRRMDLSAGEIAGLACLPEFGVRLLVRLGFIGLSFVSFVRGWHRRLLIEQRSSKCQKKLESASVTRELSFALRG